MSERMSLDAYRALQKLGPVQPAPRLAAVADAPRTAHPGGRIVSRPGSATHKYRAIACDGPDGMGGTRRYPSKREARMAARLEQEREIGGIVAWLPQVSVIVGQVGGKAVRHVVDALVIAEVHPDGSFRGRLVEAKGFRHRTGERKRAALERLTGTVVEVV